MLIGAKPASGGRTALAVLGVATLAAAAGVSTALARSDAPVTVKVVLSEWKLTPSAGTAKPGPVTFVVRNAGGIPHEFVVLKTVKHHHAVPMVGSEAVERGKRAEITELKPAQTRRVTVQLQPGRYVLLCNLPGHYKAGQFAALVVR